MKLKLLIVALFCSILGWGQISLPNTTPVTENFNSMGTNAVAALPANWKLSTAGNTTPTWAAAGFISTNQQASTGTPATGGRYNWGNTAGTDRALGVMTSAGYVSPNSIMAQYRNTNAVNLTQLAISYKLERYRRNSAAASVQFYYSTDGSTWTAVSAGDVAAASIPTGTNVYDFTPGLTVNVATFNITGLSIPNGGDIYLRWNLNTTGANSQGIGIDDVSVTATFNPPIYTLLYNGNGNTGGSVPVDGNLYSFGDFATILGNTGSLVKTGFNFNGWNAVPDGSSLHLDAGNTLEILSYSIVYAEWVPASPPVITSALTASGTQGSPFTYSITATNTPTSYNAAVLPAGLSINTTTGVISGTPTVSGTYNITITATNGTGSDNKTLVLTLGTGPCLTESFGTNTLPSGWIQTSVNFVSNRAEFSANNGQLTTIAVSNPLSLTFTLERTTSSVAKTMLVEVSTTTQGGTYTTLATYDHSNTTSGGTVNCTVDLSAFTAFATVYIKFRKASASSVARWGLDDIQVFCGAPCTPATIVATPNSGPVATEVTLTATTGSLTGATVSFGAINATIVSNNGTQMVVIVPVGATTGNIKVTDSQPCDATVPFTVISRNISSCEGFSTSDLIIYDIHDEQTGSGGFITLYNGTGATVNLINYTIWRTTDYGDGNEIDYANLTGSIAPGALGILKVSPASCGPASTNGTIDGGFNDNDGIQLRNAAGSIVIDDVRAYSSGPGYYMVRNTGALNARTTYVAADWSTTPLGAGVCFPSAGLILPTAGGPPAVTTHPTYSPSCGSTSAVLTTAATEGFSGGLSLTYQWYYTAPGDSNWTIVTNGGIYSGATSAALSISNVTGVLNYQYYCQIREDLATCYTASNAVKISDSNSTTWNGTIWSNGNPTLTKAAIIDGTYTTAIHGNFSCCSLTVNTTRTLTISSTGYVEVQNNVSNNGTFIVLNNGSLVQINDAGVNTGNIQYNRTANVRLQDYVYWSAPTSSAAGTANFPITSVSPGTPTSVIWKWGPISPSLNGGQGMWLNTTENMIKGIGYAVRGPSGTSNSTTTSLNVNFIGVPNNGIIPITVQRGSDLNAGTPGPNGIMRTVKDDNSNLIGNPYPSAIDADLFIDTYGNPLKPAFYADIEGSVRIWSHNSLPSTLNSNPFYASYQYNYSANDYITYNSLGAQTGPSTFNGKIAAGQGFFVLMNDGPIGSNTINFKNSLRDRSFDNGQFFRASSSTTNQAVLEKHRIWLDLISPSNSVVRALVGYADEATNEKDNTFDAVTDSKNTFNLYSIVNEEILCIQGRKLPFNINDKIQLGINAPSSGNYKISIASADGIFSNSTGGQKIYLEDKELNIIHDLTLSPYSFNTQQGTNNNRFILRYTEVALANETFVNSDDDVLVYTNNQINIHSKNENIKEVTVYDMLGRLVFSNKKVNDKNCQIPMVENNIQLIIKITLQNEMIIYKKIIN